MISVCTIIAGNYLASARVLADSFFTHHPEGSFTVLIVDDERRKLDDLDHRMTSSAITFEDIGRIVVVRYAA